MIFDIIIIIIVNKENNVEFFVLLFVDFLFVMKKESSFDSNRNVINRSDFNLEVLLFLEFLIEVLFLIRLGIDFGLDENKMIFIKKIVILIIEKII